jgi:alpha-beta hydrolase superfamily lysophospholipase
MHQFFKSTFFNFELVRILSAAPFEGAEIAECLVACSQIRDGDAESWHRAWYTQAEKALHLAEEAEAGQKCRNSQPFTDDQIVQDRASARRAYLRASNYFRASAYMFIDRNRERPEPRVPGAAKKAELAFGKAMNFLDGTTATTLDIPFESGITLPGYLYTPTSKSREPTTKCPVLIHLGGADSSKEELYYVYAATGPELGYAVVTLDGPGQGSVLRRQGQKANMRLTSRPDWEHVIEYVIDYLEELVAEHPDLYHLDLSRIAVAGASMGGYYALRAAADPRVAACVALDPFYDMYDFATSHMGPAFGALLGLWSSGWLPSSVLDGLIRSAMAVDFRTDWEIGLVQWLMGSSSPTQALLQMRRYTFAQKDGTSFLARVKCPVLVSSAGQSLYLKPGTDARRVYDGLSEIPARNKSVWSASKPEEGGLQAKIGAIGLCAQRTFSFLNQHLGCASVVSESEHSSTTVDSQTFEHV